MLERLRNQIGTAGLVVAIVALVAALGGGAYAATGGPGGGKATASAKGKPGPRGKTGKTGKMGPAGPVGPAGPAGAVGPKGDSGAAGAAGAAGTSVTNTALSPGQGGCAEGGAQFQVGTGTPTQACNGEEGPQGPAGPSCSASGECLLPAGATESGVWSFVEKGTTQHWVSLSYPLRLVAAPEFKWVNVANSGTPGAVAGCPGTFSEPKAEAGKLCVYAKELLNIEAFTPETTKAVNNTIGIILELESTEPASEAYGYGSWAVKR
jgi:hypothetical protein